MRSKIEVRGVEVSISSVQQNDYISLTDIARFRDAERTDYILQNWLRTRSTIEFMGLWEIFNNPGFKPIEFDGFKNEAGSNSFSLTKKPNCVSFRPESLGICKAPKEPQQISKDVAEKSCAS